MMSGFDFQIKENISDNFTFEPPKAHRQAFPEVPLLPEESLRANGDPLTEHDLARKIPEDVKYGKQESGWEVPDHKRNDVLESYRFDLEGNVIGKLSKDWTIYVRYSFKLTLKGLTFSFNPFKASLNEYCTEIHSYNPIQNLKDKAFIR
jgi:hypothetical protein